MTTFTDPRTRLAELRQQKSELRDRLKDAREASDGARVRMLDDASRANGQAVTKAVKYEAQLRTELESINDEEVTILGKLAGGNNGGGGLGAGSFLGDPEARHQLQQMASSKMPVGRVNLGPYVSRDELVEEIGQCIETIGRGGGIRSQVGDDTLVPDSARRGPFYGIVPALRRPLRLLDLIPSAPMDSASFDYLQEIATAGPGASGFDTAFETQEGAVKPQAQVFFLDATAKAETIAHFTKVRKQSLADVDALNGLLRTRLSYGVLRRVENQLIAGGGPDSNELQGIIGMPGVGEVEYDVSTLSADQSLSGVTTVLIAEATPNAILLNPLDWQDMLIARATGGDEQYFSGGPFVATAQQLWQIPAIPSTAVPVGSGIVGDFATGATLFVREAVNVLASDSDSDDFTRNRVTLLGEGRFASAIWQPSAFCVVTFRP